MNTNMYENQVTQAGAGFGVDTNIITVITKTGIQELPLLSKEEAANTIWDQALFLTR